VDNQPWSDQHSYYPMLVAERAGLNAPHDLPHGTIRAMTDAGMAEIRRATLLYRHMRDGRGAVGRSRPGRGAGAGQRRDAVGPAGSTVQAKRGRPRLSRANG